MYVVSNLTRIVDFISLLDLLVGYTFYSLFRHMENFIQPDTVKLGCSILTLLCPQAFS